MEKRRAQREARREAIRQEDIANGVYIRIGDMPKLEPKKGA